MMQFENAAIQILVDRSVTTSVTCEVRTIDNPRRFVARSIDI